MKGKHSGGKIVFKLNLKQKQNLTFIEGNSSQNSYNWKGLIKKTGLKTIVFILISIVEVPQKDSIIFICLISYLLIKLHKSFLCSQNLWSFNSILSTEPFLRVPYRQRTQINSIGDTHINRPTQLWESKCIILDLHFFLSKLQLKKLV